MLFCSFRYACNTPKDENPSAMRLKTAGGRNREAERCGSSHSHCVVIGVADVHTLKRHSCQYRVLFPKYHATRLARSPVDRHVGANSEANASKGRGSW